MLKNAWIHILVIFHRKTLQQVTLLGLKTLLPFLPQVVKLVIPLVAPTRSKSPRQLVVRLNVSVWNGMMLWLKSITLCSKRNL